MCDSITEKEKAHERQQWEQENGKKKCIMIYKTEMKEDNLKNPCFSLLSEINAGWRNTFWSNCVT